MNGDQTPPEPLLAAAPVAPPEPEPAPAFASLTLRFESDNALREAMKAYASRSTATGLCIRVSRRYEVGQGALLVLETGQGLQVIHGAVSWSRADCIGLRFEPATADENRTLQYLRKLCGHLAPQQAPERPAPPVGEIKPFTE